MRAVLREKAYFAKKGSGNGEEGEDDGLARKERKNKKQGG